MIVIYRVTDKKVRMTKAAIAAMEDKLCKSRIDRDGIVELFTTGQFNELKLLPTEYHNAPRLRIKHKTSEAFGYVVKPEDLGRTGRADQSVANSIRLWIVQNIGIDPKAFMIVSE